MTAWSEIVTTALLGTGRRSLPSGLPGWAASPGPAAGGAESWILDLAAAHRVASRAGARPTSSGGVTSADPIAVPQQRLRFAPPQARRVLDALVSRPDPTTTNLWLAACVRHGCGLATEHWAALASMSHRSTTYDRRLVALTMGERGRWFVHQNPEWQRLAVTLDTFADQLVDQAGPRAPDLPTIEQLHRDPEQLLAVPDPWPDAAVHAAYVGLVNGRMGSKARWYARALGARLTLTQYAALGTAARHFLELPQLTPAARRGVRGLFVEIERVGFDRVEVERAFDQSVERIFRVSIPPV